MSPHLTNERGAVFAYIAIAMTAFIALMVVGVDVGRLAFTATEVQTVADIAATAGARRMLRNQQNGTNVDPEVDAQNVVASGGNMLDGQAASISLNHMDIGTWNFQTGVFSAGGTAPNAFRANPQEPVNNFVAGLLGPQNATTTVEKIAVAAVSGAGSGKPQLPLAIQSCQFTAYQGSGNCSSLPTLNQAPAVGNSCWTSLDPIKPASSDNEVDYLPLTCCQGGNCGEGQPPQTVNIGSVINVTNGAADVVLKIIEDCYDDGLREWIVPVVTPCGECTGASTVVGFATIVIDQVVATGSPKYISLHSVCRENPPGAAGGGGNFGVVGVSMVN